MAARALPGIAALVPGRSGGLTDKEHSSGCPLIEGLG
jgi:hypothetical protein